ncbi:LOW QUALITY PROTEIN: syntaxin-8-like [Dermacentor silvarum]|uniref:LOW QUALITY PROTEIN: syntaxin-8-like n=1 Tax=Dermacentor silvarum TaxID=543639 RepID=UPI0018982675|nr:LOW QUALITY PROTEIN: syntaxin-8-like [Dermacentor silvarum]
MALSGADPWLTAYDACETKRREIMGLIMQRNQYGRQTAAYVQTTGKVRQMIRQYMMDASKLQEDLSKSSLLITTGEVERRQYMANTLLTKGRELDALLMSKAPTAGQPGRQELLGTELSSVSEGGWNGEETEATQNLNVGEIREQQQRILREQDRGLEGLSHVLGRQKEMAIGFNEELNLHNEIIDDISEHTDRMRERLIRETKNVTIVDKKSGTCWYWVVIVLLMVAIIVVAAVKF